jgi:hypothetical protein
MADISIKETTYGQYGKCIALSNGRVELMVTVDMGPRIIRFGFSGKENELCENAPTTVEVGEGQWKLMGGHRLWHSPESNPRTYMPDNQPVEWREIDGGIRVIQQEEPWVQIVKEMDIKLASCCNKVSIVHRLTNKNAWPVELSVWALTVMAAGGKEVVPQPQRDTGLLANRLVALWPYAKMNDLRVYWGDKYITLQQDASVDTAFKLGIPNEDGWAAYFNHGNLFIKRYHHRMDAQYPDFGVSYETYTNDYMVEMESLSPMTLLQPDETVAHVEEWELIEGVPVPSNDEGDIHRIVKEYISCCGCCE